MPLQLIINADDFGLTPGVNRAVIELHQAGVVTSTTLMATGAAFDDAIDLALRHPTLGVGCHLVFVDGTPVSHPESIPTLLGADGKTFRPSLLDFAQAVLRGTVREDDLARETQAQIQRLQQAGIDVTHVDTHKHTHALPHVAETILHVAQRCGVCALRFPFEPGWSVKMAEAPLLRRAQMYALARFQPRVTKILQGVAESGLLPSGTLGIAATGLLEKRRLCRMLEALCTDHDDGNTFELCCHPGYAGAELRSVSTRLQETREVEREALLNVVPEILKHPEAPELIHYGQLGVAGTQRALGQFLQPTGYEKVL